MSAAIRSPRPSRITRPAGIRERILPDMRYLNLVEARGARTECRILFSEEPEVVQRLQAG